MIYLNDMQINLTIFPDKTSQVWKLHEPCLNLGYADIRWDFDSESELMHLAQLRDLIKSFGNPVCTLFITYLPYGRQDKRIDNNSTFALRTFAKFVNFMRFDKVTCLDPHSEVALDIFKNFVAVYPTGRINTVMEDLESSMICFPDKGALLKYGQMFPGRDYINALKERDQATGKILKYSLNGSARDHDVLIVDDICDGGATFIALAELLYAGGATEVNLFVTHGIFSKGLKVLKDAGIKRIFTYQGEMGYDPRNSV